MNRRNFLRNVGFIVAGGVLGAVIPRDSLAVSKRKVSAVSSKTVPEGARHAAVEFATLSPGDWFAWDKIVWKKNVAEAKFCCGWQIHQEWRATESDPVLCAFYPQDKVVPVDPRKADGGLEPDVSLALGFYVPDSSAYSALDYYRATS